jgi:hypothetical protein
MFTLPIYISCALRRFYRKLPAYGLNVEVTFSEDAVSTHTSKSEGRMSWDLFQSAILAKEGLLLYPNKFNFHWIPRSAFSSPEDFASCIELAGQKIGDVKRKGI